MSAIPSSNVPHTLHPTPHACLRELLSYVRRTTWVATPSADRFRAEALAFVQAALDAETSGGDQWLTDDAERFDQLLRVGNKALQYAEPRLALLVADTALGVRSKSRAAWRLRGRALESLGSTRDALQAHHKYLELTKKDSLHVGERVGALEAQLHHLQLIIGHLASLYPTSDGDDEPAVEQLWGKAQRARANGDNRASSEFMARAIVQLYTSHAPTPKVQDALVSFASQLLGSGDDIDQAGTFAALYGAYGRTVAHELPLEPPPFPYASLIGIHDFRNIIAGKTVCMVANSAGIVEDGTQGERIDSYDIVVRFNSFAIDAKATGHRTDIHATIHLHDYNWARPVLVRLVFSGNRAAWTRSIRRHLVHGAQQHLGDATLRWPVRDTSLIADDDLPGIPTTGFNMIRLLDFLDVNPAIDLFGFDFYRQPAYRLPEAMHLPIAQAHTYDYERRWVHGRIRRTDGIVASLRD